MGYREGNSKNGVGEEMKDKSYTIMELQRLYSIFLCDISIGKLPDIIDTEDKHFIPRKFLIWLRKREAK